LAALLLALGLFLLSKAHAYENYYALKDIQSYHCRMRVIDNRVEHEDCLIKWQFHLENAERCYKDAHEACWWWPNLSERKKIQYCLTNAAVMAAPKTSAKSKIITAIITTLTQFGLDVQEEWSYINTKLYWAQYHYEMAEFYENMLNHV
jgi:hypothetical protein